MAVVFIDVNADCSEIYKAYFDISLRSEVKHYIVSLKVLEYMSSLMDVLKLFQDLENDLYSLRSIKWTFLKQELIQVDLMLVRNEVEHIIIHLSIIMNFRSSTAPKFL